jgi:hypothetical protein
MAKVNNKIKSFAEINNIKKNLKDDDSSIISSYDSKCDSKCDNKEKNNYKSEFDDLATLDDDNISKKAEEHYFKTELLEKIIKYIKIDNKIKELQKEVREEVKSMKTQKEDMEKYILGYLDTINQEFVSIAGEGKLTKTVTNTKGTIKIDNIKSSITDELTKSNLLERDKITNLLDSIIETIEKNRPVKSKTYIKRTAEKVKKTKKEKLSKKNEENVDKNVDEDEDESIPKYSK